MLRKLTSDVINEILERLEADTPIANTEPGSIVRSLVEIISEVIGGLYRELDLMTAMGFVSSAKGNYLDMIGQLLNCTRIPGETDENYRTRITKQVYVIAGANETAVRLKVLGVEGVRDILMREFIRGTGSFGVYVITDDPATPQTILNEVQEVLEEAKAYGIYAEARRPVLIPLELMVRLIFEDGTPVSQRVIERENAKRALQEYVSNIPIGGRFIVTEAIKTIKASGNNMIDLDIYQMKVDGVERFLSNVQATSGERIYLEHVDVS